MKRVFIFLFLLLNYIDVSAQIKGDQSFNFLNIAVSPVQSALGGNNVTIYNDNTTQPIYNPAALNATMNNELALSYVNLFKGVNSGMMTYAKSFKNERNVHLGVTYLNYGEMDGYDEFGNETGQFSGNDIAVSLGYALPIEDTGIRVGSNLKFISSTLERYQSYAAAVDFGALYIHPTSGFHIGLAVKNLGIQLKSYQDIDEKLPLNVTFGISKQLEKVPIRWHLTLEHLETPKIAFTNPNRTEVELDGTVKEEKVGFFQHALRHVIVGAELFSDKKFNLRFAYNFRRGEELSIVEKRTFSGLSAGFSFTFNKFRIAYTHSRMTLVTNTHVIGCAVKL